MSETPPRAPPPASSPSPRPAGGSPRATSPTSRLAERREAAVALGHPAYRAVQLSTHYFERLVDSPEEMTDLPKAVRDDLVGDLLPSLLTPVRSLTADRGATVKQVWRLFDGALVESVLMRYPNRVTVCISSQAGCGMNCPFCATGQEGLTRNMSAAEIVEQVVVRRPPPAPRRAPGDRRRRGAGADGAGLGDEADGSEGEPLRTEPGQQRRLHGDGRGAGQLQGRDRRDPPAHRAGPLGPRASRRAASRCRRSGWCPASTSSPRRASR